MGWSRGKIGKRAVLGVGVFRDLVLGMMPGDTFGAWLNFPNSGFFWQKEPFKL
jgi:hypothetical protein